MIRKQRTGSFGLSTSWQRALLAATAMAGLPTVASAANTAYYVDCSASNPGNGTEGSPWNSLASVNNKPGGYGAGDSILFKAGTTCTGRLDLRSGGGAAGAPLTITFYGSGARPIIAGAGLSDAAIYILNMAYVTITGLEVTNTPGFNSNVERNGIFVEAVDNNAHPGIIIDNNDVHDVSSITSFVTLGKFSSAAINARTTYEEGFNGHFVGLRITNNYVHDTYSIGIATSGGRLGGGGNTRNVDQLVRGNTVLRAGADGIVIASADTPITEYNVVRQSGFGGDDLRYIVAIWSYNAKDPIFQFNEVSGTLPTGDSQAFDCDFKIVGTCTIQYNYSFNNAGGFLLDTGDPVARNVIVRYNMSINEARIIMQQNSIVQFYNNVFYAPGYYYYVNANGNNLTMRNNIFVGANFVLDANVPTNISNNIYYGMSPPSADTAPIVGDPLFVSPGNPQPGLNSLAGYMLNAGSPALNAGLTIANNGGRDYFGNTVPAAGAPNIGAYQSMGTGGGGGQPPQGLVNGSFETGASEGGQTLSGWTTNGFGSSADADYTESYGGAFDGTYHATHYKTSPYEVYTSQVVSGLANGTYTLSAYVRSSGGQTYALMDIKNYAGAGSITRQNISATPSWTRIEIPNVNVTAGSAEVGFYSNAPGNTWLYFDKVELTPGSGSPPPGGSNPVVNPGLETGSFSGWTWTYGNTAISTNAAAGSYAGQATGTYSGFGQVVTGLTPSTSYTLTAQARVDNAAETVAVGVKNFVGLSGDESQIVSSTSYTPVSVTFTTGPTSTSAEIYTWRNGGSGTAWSDSFNLQPTAVGPNRVANPGLESGSFSGWTWTYGNTAISGNAAAGSYAGQATGTYSGFGQTLTGLTPNTTYTLTAQARVDTTGEEVWIGAKEYAGPNSDQHQTITSTSYAPASVTFTTGPSSTTAQVYMWRNGGSGSAYADSFVVQ